MSTIAPTPDDIVLQPLDYQVETNALIEAHRERQLNLQSRVDLAIVQIENSAVRGTAQSIMEQVLRLLDWLCLIESNLQKLDTLRENLSLLELLHFEARSLVEFIAGEAMHTPGITKVFHDLLDGINYTITHDLRRVFESELVGPIAEQSIPVVYGKIMHAHGLLTNFLQQSTITLVQLFDPSLDGSSLFNDSEQRLKQSLTLCTDLSSLITCVQRLEDQLDQDGLSNLVKQIVAFRDGSMQYLMYRDWQGYEKLTGEIMLAIDDERDPKPLLHQFLCYLETIFGHVRMRAVLTNVAIPESEESRD